MKIKGSHGATALIFKNLLKTMSFFILTICLWDFCIHNTHKKNYRLLNFQKLYLTKGKVSCYWCSKIWHIRLTHWTSPDMVYFIICNGSLLRRYQMKKYGTRERHQILFLQNVSEAKRGYEMHAARYLSTIS